jgi:hypothetical protein
MFWLGFWLAMVLAAMPDLTLRFVQRYFYPTNKVIIQVRAAAPAPSRTRTHACAALGRSAAGWACPTPSGRRRYARSRRARRACRLPTECANCPARERGGTVWAAVRKHCQFTNEFSLFGAEPSEQICALRWARVAGLRRGRVSHPPRRTTNNGHGSALRLEVKAEVGGQVNLDGCVSCWRAGEPREVPAECRGTHHDGGQATQRRLARQQAAS